MTTSNVQTVLRTLFVHPRDPAPTPHDRPLPTPRLLRDLGHEVLSTPSLDDAIRILERETVDLLIIDEPERTNGDFQQQTMARIEALPIDQQPRDVAFFSESSDAASRVDSLIGPRVHVLLKPLHVHGLLQLLRSLE